MGNTNSRNVFNEFLQSSYSRKFRPAKYKRYTVGQGSGSPSNSNTLQFKDITEQQKKIEEVIYNCQRIWTHFPALDNKDSPELGFDCLCGTCIGLEKIAR